MKPNKRLPILSLCEPVSMATVTLTVLVCTTQRQCHLPITPPSSPHHAAPASTSSSLDPSHTPSPRNGRTPRHNSRCSSDCGGNHACATAATTTLRWLACPHSALPHHLRGLSPQRTTPTKGNTAEKPTCPHRLEGKGSCSMGTKGTRIHSVHPQFPTHEVPPRSTALSNAS